MRDKDELTGLFRSRLNGAGMTVREGFWERLQEDMPPSAASRKKTAFLSPKYYRVAAAASVVFVLGAASAAFWYFSPKEEIKEAFTQVAVLTPEGSLDGDAVQEAFPSIHPAAPAAQNTGMKQPVSGIPAGMAARQEGTDESVSVRFSITIRQRVQAGNGYFGRDAATQGSNPYRQTTGGVSPVSGIFSTAPVEEGQDITPLKYREACKWALKAALGTSLPKGDYRMPLTAEITVERSLNGWLALEAGVRYNRLHAGHTLHTLGIPVKLNMMLASTPKVDLYATVGGAADKCIAGAPDNGFNAEPVQLSVAAGIGVRYKLNDRFALFAEPSVSHYFDTDSETRTLRTERPTNLNLLCGVRMTY